jgi:glucosamine--fructose-6-phosphate aminotransferase (isomerizing)
MCGIVGAIGGKNLYKNVVNGLMRLEYRGYDSFGFAGNIEGEWIIEKGVGAISEVIKVDSLKGFEGATCMIAHTRWATHGGVTVQNAHPHLSFDRSVGIVHNGVITNFHDLRRQQRAAGISYFSETDTEVGANAIAQLTDGGKNIVAAAGQVFQALEGEFAIVGMCQSLGDCLFGLKRKSPLMVGVIGDVVVLASDESALGEFGSSAEVCYLDDEEFVICTSGKVTFYAIKGGHATPIEKQFVVKDVQVERSDMGGYPHYMLKEVNEAPGAVNLIRESIEPGLGKLVAAIADKSLSLVGSGSAFYASQIGQYFFSSISRRYVATHASDEILNLKTFTPEDCLVCLSQSGETFDTLEVVRSAKRAGAAVVAINNVRESTCQRMADFPLFQNAGKEVCVLSTKSIISQIAGLFYIATALGEFLDVVSPEEGTLLRSEAEILPIALNDVIHRLSDDIRKVSYATCNIEHWFFIGRGIYYPVAMESALKFKEVSYRHAEGMAAGFFKHGTISLIDKDFYTVAFLPSKARERRLFESTVDNIHEIKARGGLVIGIGNTPHDAFEENFFLRYIELPDIGSHLNSCLHLCAGQLLAYYCAVALGRNVDRPRALAKSVTVR